MRQETRESKYKVFSKAGHKKTYPGVLDGGFISRQTSWKYFTLEPSFKCRKKISLLASCILSLVGQSLPHRVQLPHPSGLCYSAPLGICWKVKPIVPQHKAWSGSGCGGRSQNLCGSGWVGLGLEAPPQLGTMEAMPKLVLILREFEMTGGIQR